MFTAIYGGRSEVAVISVVVNQIPIPCNEKFVFTGLHGLYVGERSFAFRLISKNYEENVLLVSLPYCLFAFICFYIVLRL